jgi:hypothetical protein
MGSLTLSGLIPGGYYRVSERPNRLANDDSKMKTPVVVASSLWLDNIRPQAGRYILAKLHRWNEDWIQLFQG